MDIQPWPQEGFSDLQPPIVHIHPAQIYKKKLTHLQTSKNKILVK